VCDKSDFLTSPTLFTVKCPTNLDRLLSSCFDTQTKFRLLIFAKHSMNNQSSMTPTAAQQSLPLFNLHRTVALQAIYRARCAPGTDALRFGVQTGEINLQQLLLLPYRDRNAIVERGPLIDIYLGETRIYKRTSPTLLFACCPDVGRFLEPVRGRFAICLPPGFSNALSVKLAVLYMLNSRARSAPWRTSDDFVSYI
jgi:hypothetical protein